jgi:hypothetical protein
LGGLLADQHARLAESARAAGAYYQVAGDQCDRSGHGFALADISINPDKITCLACPEWAADQLVQQAEMTEALLIMTDAQLAELAKPGKHVLTRAELITSAEEDRAMAARYRRPPS